ncbi:hypothetical protein Tco_1001101 [Tanacetum coccineum]
MPLRKSRNLNDVYEQEFEQRVMARMKERLDQFVNQLADRMNDMMSQGRRGESKKTRLVTLTIRLLMNNRKGAQGEIKGRIIGIGSLV